MRTFRVYLTRDITETAVVYVRAETEDEAYDRAFDTARDHPHDVVFEPDDVFVSFSDLYSTGCEEVPDSVPLFEDQIPTDDEVKSTS